MNISKSHPWNIFNITPKNILEFIPDNSKKVENHIVSNGVPYEYFF